MVCKIYQEIIRTNFVKFSPGCYLIGLDREWEIISSKILDNTETDFVGSVTCFKIWINWFFSDKVNKLFSGKTINQCSWENCFASNQRVDHCKRWWAFDINYNFCKQTKIKQNIEAVTEFNIINTGKLLELRHFDLMT